MAEQKKVVLMTEGSRGDHQPYIALSLVLQEKYDLLLIVNKGFQDMAKEAGVRNVDNFEFNFREEAGHVMEKMVGLSDPAEMTEMWKPIFERMFPKRKEEVVTFSAGKDIVLCSPVVTQFVSVAAKHHGIPLINLPLQPGLPTNEWPPIFMGDPDSSPPEGQTWMEVHNALMAQFVAPFNEQMNAWRESLGVPSCTIQEAINDLTNVPSCCGYSSLLVEHPADYPKEYKAVGYWTLLKDNWQPSEEIAAFLAKSDDKPLYVGFGSMVFENPDELSAHVMGAITELGIRAIICEGWGTMTPPAEYDHDRFLFVKNVYHPGLLPKCCGGVVHGGAGTTAAVARAGIPSLICPFIADQPFWATRVRNAGVGLRGPAAKEIAKENLVEKIKELISNKDLHTKAAEVGEQIRAADSYGAVVERIEEVLASTQ